MHFQSLILLSKEEKIALSVIALFVLVFFKPVIAGDGVGYYVVLEGVVRDHTFNFTQQLRYNEVFNGTAVFYWEGSKQYVSQYAPGMALLSAPFYAASLFLDDFSIFHIKDSFFLRERGDILVHQLAAIAAPLLLLAVALLFSLKICRDEKLKTGALALLLAFFGTPIIRYATYDLYYTHVAEAGLLTLLVYCLYARKPAGYSGILIGLLTMVRYTSALYLVPVGIYYLWKNRGGEAVKLGAAFAPFLLAILLYFTLAYGSPLTTGYHASGALKGNFNLIPFGIFNVLFSLQSGLLVWSPVVILALVGLYQWRDERKWPLLGLFAVMLWVTSVFFEGTTGYTFSNRYYAAMFPLFVLGLGLFLQRYAKLLWLAGMLAFYNFSLFFFALAGDFTGIFPSLPAIWDYWFVRGHISEFPRLLMEKTSVFRLLFER